MQQCKEPAVQISTAPSSNSVLDARGSGPARCAGMALDTAARSHQTSQGVTISASVGVGLTVEGGLDDIDETPRPPLLFLDLGHLE
eukprot:5786157-Prymnesium_polylepis.2